MSISRIEHELYATVLLRHQPREARLEGCRRSVLLPCFVERLPDVERGDEVRDGEPEGRVGERLARAYPVDDEMNYRGHVAGRTCKPSHLRPKPKMKLVGRSFDGASFPVRRWRSGRNSSGSGYAEGSRVMPL